MYVCMRTKQQHNFVCAYAQLCVNKLSSTPHGARPRAMRFFRERERKAAVTVGRAEEANLNFDEGQF